MEARDERERLDLRQVVMVARRRWWVTAFCMVAVGAAAFIFSASQTKQYTASASLLLRDTGVDQALLSTAVSAAPVDPAREEQTNVQLVSSPEVTARTAMALHLPESTVSDELAVGAQGETNVVAVRATDHSPRRAAAIANAYAQQAVAFSRDTDRAQLLETQAAIQAQIQLMTKAQRASSYGQLLATRNQELATLAAADTGGAQVIQPAAVPTGPSAPRTKRNLILGLLLGLLFGLAAAALAERWSRRVRGSDELGGISGLPVLTEIPESRAMSKNALALDDDERGAFHMLLGRLRYGNSGREIRSVMLTSATAKEGKSTVAWHLAQTTALRVTGRVVLLETDMRNPVLAARHGLEAAPGLAEVLERQIPLSEAIQSIPLGGTNGFSHSACLDIVVAGAAPPDPIRLMETPQMAQVLLELSETYAFMVVDTVPALLAPDAMPLMRKIGGVLIVSRVGMTTRDQATMLRQELRALGAPLLGVVANCVKPWGRQRYGYYPRVKNPDVNGYRGILLRRSSAGSPDHVQEQDVEIGEPEERNADERV